METTPPASAIPRQTVPGSAAPDATPRLVTPYVRRRAWLEPSVRRWWLLGLMILMLFTAYAGDRLWDRFEEIHLIQTGIPIQAKITGAENKINNMPFGPTDLARLEVSFTPQTVEDLTGYLSASNVVGSTVMLHVDAADHTRWTDRTVPTPLLDSMLIGLLLLPLIPVMIWIAFIHAKKVQLTWQNGQAQVGVIFERKQSPLAPMSYAIRCSLQGGRQKQLFTVYVPRVAYGLEKGDLIWVITPPRKGRSIAALWMAGEQA